jgi:hypothetical protein
MFRRVLILATLWACAGRPLLAQDLSTTTDLPRKASLSTPGAIRYVRQGTDIGKAKTLAVR